MRLVALSLAANDWRNGRQDGYPTCCIAHYCWDSLFDWPSAVVRWNQIEYDPADDSPQVVCGVLHSGGSLLTLGRRVVAILGFQWAHLWPNAGNRGEAIYPKLRSRPLTAELERWFRESYELDQSYWVNQGLDSELEWT